MAEPDDPADAAARLEEALERIAALADRVGATSRSESMPEGAVDGAALADRLDALIAKLRTALANRPA